MSGNGTARFRASIRRFYTPLDNRKCISYCKTLTRAEWHGHVLLRIGWFHAAHKARIPYTYASRGQAPYGVSAIPVIRDRKERVFREFRQEPVS